MHFGMYTDHIDAVLLSDCHCTLPASERTLPQSSPPSSSLPSSRRVRVRRVRGPTHPQCSARPQKRRHALLLLLLLLFPDTFLSRREWSGSSGTFPSPSSCCRL